RPVLAETFVQIPCFRGTCYQAANWLYVGDTTGRGRLARDHRATLPKKPSGFIRSSKTSAATSATDFFSSPCGSTGATPPRATSALTASLSPVTIAEPGNQPLDARLNVTRLKQIRNMAVIFIT